MRNSYYKPVVVWLFVGAAMVVGMVVIGGITRLTESGLSMVDWHLFSGTIPPLNEADWQTTFDQYKNYPEYQKVNFDMRLSEFKSIFFWEWLHRVLGRTIGLVFVFPFLYFLRKKKINTLLRNRLWWLLGLGALQGFLGWFMVKSGLVDNPSVSHFRLTIHLCAAFLTFSYILWLILGITRSMDSSEEEGILSVKRLVRWFVPVLVLQIIYGAFVAGLDAGMVYPTWPKMGEYWVPPQVYAAWHDMGISGLWHERVSVQFVHRIIAYIVFAFASMLWFKSLKITHSVRTKKAVVLLMIAVLIQVFLGVSTLMMNVPVFMGVLHQLGALFVLSSTVYLVFLLQKTKVDLTTQHLQN